MHPHQALLQRLLERLAAGDAAGAAACYDTQVFVTNPLFPRLRGDEARDFWAFFFGAVHDFHLEIAALSAGDEGGHATWKASYRIACNGRRVRVAGRSLFAFRDGRVCRQYDHFSLWRWAAQVLGPVGAVAGWFGPFRWALRRSLARRLEH